MRVRQWCKNPSHVQRLFCAESMLILLCYITPHKSVSLQIASFFFFFYINKGIRIDIQLSCKGKMGLCSVTSQEDEAQQYGELIYFNGHVCSREGMFSCSFVSVALQYKTFSNLVRIIEIEDNLEKTFSNPLSFCFN